MNPQITPRLRECIAAGKALTPDEREIAVLMLQFYKPEDHDQAEIDAAWDAEIDRRLSEVLNDEVELINGEDTLATIRQMIDEHRSLNAQVA